MFPKCDQEAFPFHDVSQLSSTISSSNSSSIGVNAPRPSTMHLSIFFFNARSLLPKLDELRGICADVHYDLVIVAESWLSADVLDSEIHIPGFCNVRNDRNRHGGGIVIYISDNINFTILQLPHPDLELILLECSLKSHVYTVGGFYRPPNADSDCMSKLYSTIAALRPLNLW